MDRVPNDVGRTALSEVSPRYRSSGARQILGIKFFSGDAAEAIERMRRGGLLVAPAAPALTALPKDKHYREALLAADVAIIDSAFMAMLWNLLEGDNLRRLSGLEYFSHLVNDPEFRQRRATLYVMASDESSGKNLQWLKAQGVSIDPDQLYVAPIYGSDVVDPELLRRISEVRPRHVVITLGGGIQERLGVYLKRSLDYAPSIHCIGAAIAFCSGDQVLISPTADRLALGWLLRCLWRPRSYVPRYWAARKLAWLLYKHRAEVPPLSGYAERSAVESPASAA